jgi:general secretion pathway protein A
MYNGFFGLHKKPFNMTPDPGLLFLTARHREALVGLTYAIMDRKGFVVLTGDAGTGKTTLLARVLQNVPAAKMQSSVILNPTLTPAEFLELVMLDFGIQTIPSSKARRLAIMQRLLLEGNHEGRICTLVIDEAHKLSLDVLEEVRLLGNFEHGDEKLLQILLIGQNELSDLLERDDLRQLKQRIALRFTIEPLAGDDVEQYIRFRWTLAGGAEPLPFGLAAVTQIAHASRGIPRVINSVCDNALMLAFSEGARLVEERHVREAAGDLKLTLAAPLPAPAAAPTPVATLMEPMATEPLRLRTLERYGNGNGAPRSFFGRWAGRRAPVD